MGIRLLGPVELRAEDGTLLEVAGSQRRAVLALLALQLGRPVAIERFFELLWGDRPPAHARAALQGHIAALRKVLCDSAFTLHTRAPGYLLTGAPEQVDLGRFEDLVARAEGATATEAASGTQTSVRTGPQTGTQTSKQTGARTTDDTETAQVSTDAATEAAALLQQALDLWRGAPLADLPDTDLRRALAGRLQESWTQVLISWSELRLRLGSGAAAVPALEQSVRADGLREPVAALLIRCLHQAGRTADALTAYHQARERLDSQLGITPGPALRAAFATALSEEAPAPDGHRAARQPHQPAPERAAMAERPTAAERSATGGQPPLPVEPTPATTATATGERAAAPAVSRQLPRQIAGFVGRSLESHWLDRECGEDRVGDGLAVVVGPAGVGKSATVIRWAHSAAAAFPDGQLFVDLRGFDPAGPVDQGDVLGQFLIALGVPEAGIPEDAAARGALYRTQTERRRLLVVLDNARSAADVVGLLPIGPNCSTVVTSRNTLEDLVVTEGAALLRLEALPDDDALRLLERALTPLRVQAEPQAAQQLITLCDRLPLALRIAASRLSSRPSWAIADVVAELTDERTRLHTLDTQGATSVRAALTLTYRHLSSTAARLVVLLAAHPGREVDGYAAAALLRCHLHDARRTLGELASYHLLTENVPGRYTRHDLIRLFSMELYADQPAEERKLSSDRLLDYYLTALRLASDHLDPGIESYGEREHPPLAFPEPADARASLAWFRLEEPTIRALVTAASADGRHEHAWRMARISESLYYGTGRLTDELACLRAGLRAAERTGSTQALAVLEGACANALFSVSFPDEALSLARQAVERTVPADGNTHLRAVYSLALISAQTGDLAQGRELADRAVGLSEAAEVGALPEHQGAAQGYAATIKLMAGDPVAALTHAREARRLLADYPASTLKLLATLNEAQILHLLGNSAATEPLWATLLVTTRETGFLHLQAVAEKWYASFLVDLGRLDEAAEHLRVAINLHQLHGHVATALTEQLADIEATLAP
ncbi:AfsR/SARP family transcriptional regulator [Kitasatospora kifunensis]|uniref:DNA-binding SARP family transcriptional activator n=1 Tax=Kitasatospora kifunensis TaxID=58351 RepID=A0A7W7QWW2_KITKI|nr:BTAD domain-containing putative transcriptional regulator [Kitasatospora kifunensis]MBB4921276.1 DNA-binding SARP family transcriptional activator [Kitasatospora kifunensis]